MPLAQARLGLLRLLRSSNVPTLFDRQEGKKAELFRAELLKVVNAAFGGEADELHGTLLHLAPPGSLSPNDPAFNFPIERCWTNGCSDIRVSASLHLDPASHNSAMRFDISVKTPTSSLKCSVLAEKAQEAKSWLIIRRPIGCCSAREEALSDLSRLASGALTFQLCSS